MFLAGFILTAAVAAAQVDWSQITPNLPAAQVRQTLGQPKEIKTVAAGEVWYYFADHDTGFVRLKNHRTLGLIVLDATPPTAEQIAAAAPKPAPLPAPPQMPVRPVPVTPPPAVVPPAPAPLPVTPPLSAEARPAPKAKADPGSRYFLGCGIAFIALAAVFAVAQTIKRLG
ncbi:hypothetical protein ACQ9LF_06210 [Anaerohalosphaeraceae bacterium U12dextr]